MAAILLLITRLICPAPMPNVALSLTADDGIRFDIFRDAPGENQDHRAPPESAARLRDRAQFLRAHRAGVARLHQQTAGDALVLEQLRHRQRQIADDEHAHIVPRRQHAPGVVRNARRQNDLDELPLDDGARRRCVQFAIEGDDAAVRGGRIGAIRTRIGLADRCCSARRRRDWHA